MRISTTKRAHALALGLAALVSVPALAGTAAAAPAEMYAPYARAAAKVQGNGTLLAAKNIDTARRVNQGQYCLTVSDPDIDLSDAVVLGTTNAGGGTYSLDVRREPTTTCGNAARTITVYSAYGTSASDVWFTVAVL